MYGTMILGQGDGPDGSTPDEVISTVERSNIMADVDVLTGVYTIPPHTPWRQPFWWPPERSERYGKQYFDVSIAVTPGSGFAHPDMTPLIEVKREMTFVPPQGPNEAGRFVLFLTVQNDNDFEVEVMANHVRINN
jgi:hypothetical protein